jgi:hypothetical protein
MQDYSLSLVRYLIKAAAFSLKHLALSEKLAAVKRSSFFYSVWAMKEKRFVTLSPGADVIILYSSVFTNF